MFKNLAFHNKISMVLAISCFIFIFSMSARPADESTEMSHRVGKICASVFVPGFNQMSDARQEEIAAKIDFPVRKTAHATEFGLLALTIFFSFSEDMRLRKRSLLSILISFLYASSDEIHQLFVPGRAGMFRDVMIDTGGASFMIMIITIIKLIRIKRQ